ncbi:MAG TPA: rhomboid family intramembrane serine protease [Terriglobia bacterium]|nr:rhomboid family intramembrane serine protease [Terriglobia bacterium]
MIPLPLNDNIRRTTFWFSTLALITLNCYVFWLELSLDGQVDRLVFLYGVVPARYTTTAGLAILTPAGFLVPIFASMFLHAGWLHLVGNMLFLYVFGRSVEDRFGHFKFLFLYFASGFAGALLHIYLNAGSRMPTIGASGAIAGVLGAYFITSPRAWIKLTIFPLIFWTFELPAMLVLGYWFLIQFLQGYQMLAIENATRGGGTAWWAHVGGFVTGMLLAMMLEPRGPRAIRLSDS